MFRPLLIIIDAQNDFCDLPAGYHYQPTLSIPGAHQDCLRLAALIEQSADSISAIIATLDSHHAIDIANRHCWLDAEGNPVPAFTEIKAADLQSGRFRPIPVLYENHADCIIDYLTRLAEIGRGLQVWPAHCEIGSPGHNLHPVLRKALGNWEMRQFKTVNYLQKGENIWTENFSAIKPLLAFSKHAEPELNPMLLAALNDFKPILIAGQASSHCVRETVQDILSIGPPDIGDKLVLLIDCMSPVPGYEVQSQAFFQHVQTMGVRLTTSRALLAELLSS